ncbi:MAG: quinolinate synthase NadA [Candidatus Sungiibacteriota bacterium]|uniref:quinolinate synthase n=1 Tax=Candidatus Sungiibacteriota bacterium TaxID=2750080 RepID=A0A7T5RJD6_9BACT|nr:MAG: quinolinate synthase NadA [Candidatus Sungbacteria bacterium]
MQEIVSGDILPAREAIEAIDETDLGPPIEIPAISPDAFPENITDEERKFLRSEIQRLKEERNALILAHNYMPKDVQDIADVVGDSLYLAQRGTASNADILCEAAVLFMNQILAIMKKPHQRVLAPSMSALCSLAAHADAEKIRAWRQEHPDGIVISYVNTYVDVKAESDYCCASANSPRVILHVLAHHPGKPILFLPDVYLGFYAAKLLQQQGESLDRLWLMMGVCHVHDRIRPHHVEAARKLYPGAAAVVHPECGCTSACMRQISDGLVPSSMMQFRSTQGMIDFVKQSPQRVVIVATEVGNLVPMSKAAPDKVLIPANREAVCAFMKQNTLRGVYGSLRDLKYEISIDDPELAKRARIPIERMLAIV